MSLLNESLVSAAQAVIRHHLQTGTMVATAESCTGGLVAAALTSVAGSSAVLERGFVTYSNLAKSQMLGVAEHLIDSHGAVSDPVAKAMAEGALAHSAAQVAVSITGIAGPGGGTTEKPVGLVHFALARQGKPTTTHRQVFSGDRDQVRGAAGLYALNLLMSA
ncbi:CinA family protein [Magnetospirillum sp. 64-120]|uniref:CinA family protein n=1 Tax=Magnetospirillum sp. 64-120 TaxID=1895778 RepID=UPI00092ABA92|nr:CinA family protein [Magnetospirillum sp. 64-120]OJX81129.1 MAG: damage-inducible protein CinA [Magnetospirillum sp. 64-120]